MDSVLKLTWHNNKKTQNNQNLKKTKIKEWTSENVLINFTGNASKFISH